MNQILISEKLYVTPEIKKKKKVFKIELILSVILLCSFSTYCIYAEYDRNKSEAISQEILNSISYINTEVLAEAPVVETEAVSIEEETIIVILNAALDSNEEVVVNPVTTTTLDIPAEQKLTANDGTEYYTIGTVKIPKLGVNYPILSTTTVELLKISPCKFWGSNPNEIGNLCIVGHNYRNTKFFSKVPTLENGDIIEITDLSGRTLQYEIYEKETIDPEDVECTSQLTGGKKEITIITCTNDGKQRVVVKAMEKL